MNLLYNSEKKKHSIRFRPVFILMAVVSFLILNSCATPKPISGIASPIANLKISPNTTVLILRPVLKFERIHNEAVLPASDYQGDAIETRILTVAKNVVESRNMILVDIQNVNEEDVEAYSQIRAKSPKLSRGLINDYTNILLKSISTNNEHSTLLVNYVNVKVGSGGTWNPNSGAITSSNSKSTLHAALIQCVTGKALWMDKVLLRELPILSSQRFSEALKLLFLNFPKKERLE